MGNSTIDIQRAFERQTTPYKSSEFTLSTKDYTMADTAYRHIAEQIKEFQNSLDSEHEVGIMLASFGQPVMLAVSDIGYQNPNLIYFYGTINGRESQLIQHLNQLNFLLTSVVKQPDKPVRRIGFHTDE